MVDISSNYYLIVGVEVPEVKEETLKNLLFALQVTNQGLGQSVLS